ncbi:MAG: PEP-CTERM sorting domain-containing protein [Geobacter sp.]|nr:PEP-CTERM sorting domain-containing protein [Geobacter sp.]
MNAQRLLMVLLTVLCLTTSAVASSFTSVVVYGDSLSDNGNLFSATGVPGTPYFDGRRSNGPLAVELLATNLGVPLVDFAWIGATTGVGNYADGGTVTTLGAYSLPGMTTIYDATKAGLGPYLPGGLFIVWGGPNDVLAPSLLDSTPTDIITRALANELAIIMDLKNMGAKSILAPGMPDLGLTPYFKSLGAAAAAQGSAFTDAYNYGLRTLLPADVLFFDTASLLRSLVSNPTVYGFTNATAACFNGTTLCGDPNDYIFFDEFHPSEAAQAILAKGFESTLPVPEPSTVFLFAIGLIGTGLLRRRIR